MKVNLELDIDQLTLILARYEGELRGGERIYYGQRKALYDVYRQLSDENKDTFDEQLPLLSKEVLK